MCRLCLLIAVLLCPTLVSAQPSISGVTGTLTHGGTVTVAGSSFGSGFTPIKSDDFTGCTVGATLANGWVTTRDGAGTGPAYPSCESAVLRHARNTRSGRANYPYVDASNYGWNSQFGVTGIDAWAKNGIYMDTYARMALDGTNGTDYPRNVKPMWLNGAENGSNPSGEPISVFIFAFYNPDTSTNCVIDQNGVSGLSNETTIYMTGCGARPADTILNNWVHLQFYATQGTTDTLDGSFWLRMNGNVIANDTTIIDRQTGHTLDWDRTYFGGYMGHDALGGQGGAFPFNGYVYYSDPIILRTAARVELCSSSTYNQAGNHCETQRVTSWGASSIDVTVWQGSFGSSDTVYPFVCNSTNTCSSAGASVTFGGGPSGPRSKPRIHLRVQWVPSVSPFVFATVFAISRKRR